MKIYSSAFYLCTHSVHFNETNCTTGNNACCWDGPGNTNTDADSNRTISIRELKEAVFEKVRSLTGGRQKPTSRVEIMDDWIIWE